MAAKNQRSGSIRPMPPESLLLSEGGALWGQFLPAPEIEAWVRAVILEEDGNLFNEDHIHLREASIGFLWTNVQYIRQAHQVVGTAEMPMFRCGAWQKGRQEQQLREWFGDVPDFVITLDALYAATASDAVWAAVVEHELYHCGQERDAFGSPKFTQSGLPKFQMRGHDVEEFVGIVRRYGAGNSAGATAKLVEASKNAPAIANVDIARACGTCLLKAA
ncbi:putative metallopeptidase [Sideroxydans lithotrophicus]|nr:putative metallopeptidase [Sideroxydans lithotrophicus]